MKTSKRPRKYFVREEEGIFSVEVDYFDQIDSRFLALGLGMQCLNELYRFMREDAIEGDDTYIGNMKVTTGLSRTLTELDRRYPYLMRELYTLLNNNN